VYALGLDLGLAHAVALALWLSLAASLTAAILFVGRRGDDRRAFVLALTAALAISPIVWLHYFVLLLVIVAVVHPRLGPIWFIGLPLQFFVTTSNGNGTTRQTAAVLVVAAVTVLAALRSGSPRERVDVVSSPVAPTP
jgi:hypothetical protein